MLLLWVSYCCCRQFWLLLVYCLRNPKGSWIVWSIERVCCDTFWLPEMNRKGSGKCGLLILIGWNSVAGISTRLWELAFTSTTLSISPKSLHHNHFVVRHEIFAKKTYKNLHSFSDETNENVRYRRDHSHGITGPVHTYVKTDKHANFKWGVRHHVGHHYAGKKWEGSKHIGGRLQVLKSNAIIKYLIWKIHKNWQHNIYVIWNIVQLVFFNWISNM